MQDFSIEKQVPLAELEGMIREQLASGGTVVLKARGVSMLPLLRDGKTELRIGKASLPLRKYTVAFYKRANGQFVLHRIIGKTANGYVCRGDHQTAKELLSPDAVIGTLYAYRNGRRWHDPLSVGGRVCAAYLSLTAYPRAYLRALGSKLKNHLSR